MATSTISSRGQLTIPKDIRDLLCLQKGDVVEFSRVGDQVAFRRIAQEEDPLMKWVGAFPFDFGPGGSLAWWRDMRGHDPEDRALYSKGPEPAE